MCSKLLQTWLVVVAALCGMAHGEGLDGTWLKKGIDAFERVEARTSSSSEVDGQTASVVMAYVNGVLDVHLQNKVIFELLEKSAKANPSTVTPEGLKQASFFALLRKKPNDLSMHQTLAIVKKYLADNPQKWHEPASLLIFTALMEAFPPLPVSRAEPR